MAITKLKPQGLQMPTGMDSAGNPFTIPMGMPQVQVTPQIDAKSIINPAQQLQVPVPKMATPPQQFVERLQPSIQQVNQGLIQAQTRESEQRNDVLQRLLN